jgi:hypothetical protein
MGDDLVGFDEFINESEEVLRRHQSKADLIQDPPQAERFFKYIPAYSPGKAHKKFNKKQKTPQPDGWLEVKVNSTGYPATIFATQAKGDALSPKYKHNDWIYLNYTEDSSESLNQLVLVFNDKIEDVYDKCFTIRVLEVVEKKSKNSLFNEKEIHLKGYDGGEPLVLKNIVTGQEVELIGVEFQIH